jgi:hypothetical protein
LKSRSETVKQSPGRSDKRIWLPAQENPSPAAMAILAELPEAAKACIKAKQKKK